MTAPRSPWQNAYVERFIGSIRRECLDHVIILTAAGLRRVLTEHIAYYTHSRAHLGLNKDASVTRCVASSTAGCVIAIPAVGGLPHRCLGLRLAVASMKTVYLCAARFGVWSC